MPLPIFAFGASLAGFFQVISRFLVPYIILKVLLALGVTTFTIIGSTWLTGYIETTIINQFNSVPGSLSQIMIMAGFLDAIAIIFNCWIAAIQVKALKGAFKGFKVA